MSTSEKTPQERGKEVYAEAMRSLRSSGPKIGINIGIAVVIWLIGNYVFIPISAGLFIQAYAVTQLVSLTILVALAVLVLTIVKEVRDVTDAAAGIVAYNAGENVGEVTEEEFRSYRTAFRGFVYVLVAAAAFLLFGLQLNYISPALTAVVLIILTVWAVFTLWRSGRALGKTIERYANEWAGKLEQQTK